MSQVHRPFAHVAGATERYAILLGWAGAVVDGLTLRDLHRSIALRLLLVLAGYYAGSIVGIKLGFPPSGIAAIWPSTAILLAGLLLAPLRYWWMFLLGVVPAHLHVANFQLPEVPIVVMLCQVGSNIFLATLAAFSLRSVIGAPPQLGSLRNMGAFILLGVLATAVGCAVAAGLFLLTGWAADFWRVWHQRVLGNVFAMVTIPPVIVLAFAGQLVRTQHATWRSYFELALIIMGVLVVGIPVFGLELPGSSNLPALLLAPLPFLMWAAVRVGVGGTGLTLLIVAGIALANAYVGRGPFINQAPDVNVLSLQIFLTAISILLMLLAAVVEERQAAEESLKQTSKQAQLALAERSVQLALAEQVTLVGGFAYDIDTEIMQISQGYAAIHGLEGTTEIGRSQCLADVHPDDIRRVEQARSQSFRARRREYNVEYRITRAGSELRWVETRCFIAYASDGHPQRVLGVSIDITERKQMEEQQRMLVAELDHRVKNALATVAAIITQTQEGQRSLPDFVAALDSRIQLLARTHDLLSRSHWTGVSLHDIVQREFAPYSSGNVELDGPHVELKAEAAQAMAMVLHELTTNAAKYGALSNRNGRVRASLVVAAQWFVWLARHRMAGDRWSSRSYAEPNRLWDEHHPGTRSVRAQRQGRSRLGAERRHMPNGNSASSASATVHRP